MISRYYFKLSVEIYLLPNISLLCQDRLFGRVGIKTYMLLYRHVIVYTCVHCILYAKINNKPLVLGYVVARLDVRERMVVPSWTW